LLGILVGTASVVAMVSGGQLATNEALKQFKLLGTDLLAITINNADSEDHHASASSASLTLPQAEGIASADQAVLEVAPYTSLYDSASYNGHAVNATILGVTDSFARVVHLQIDRGRLISSFDHRQLFCVIGNKVYQDLKKVDNQDPLGKQLQVGKNFLTVVGVLKPWPENSFVYADMDASILVPIAATQTLSQYAMINNILLKLKPTSDIESSKIKITNYLNSQVSGKHLFFRSAEELVASMGKQSQILTIFLGLIGGISLLVGGIGVMNIMLVSVVERKREIGIRLAIGATQKDIRYLFLVEAILLSLVGGGLGVFCGMLITLMIALIWHWQFVFFIMPPIIGFSVSVFIGIFFGFYPAYKASKLNPIDALRSE
jgi:putative ABC transport system permease protein